MTKQRKTLAKRQRPTTVGVSFRRALRPVSKEQDNSSAWSEYPDFTAYTNGGTPIRLKNVNGNLFGVDENTGMGYGYSINPVGEDVVVTPTPYSNQTLKYMKEAIPDGFTRQWAYSGVQDILDQNKSDLEFNQAARKYADVYTAAGSPIAKPIPQSEKDHYPDRAYTYTNRDEIYLPQTIYREMPENSRFKGPASQYSNWINSSLMAEIAHQFQKNYNNGAAAKALSGEHSWLGSDFKVDGKTEYNTPGTTESQAHTYIEPRLRYYVSDNDGPSLDDIANGAVEYAKSYDGSREAAAREKWKHSVRMAIQHQSEKRFGGFNPIGHSVVRYDRTRQHFNSPFISLSDTSKIDGWNK